MFYLGSRQIISAKVKAIYQSAKFKDTRVDAIPKIGAIPNQER